MVVQSGLIENLELTDDEMAAVIGHEMAHALREHSREKAGQKVMADAVVGLLAIAAGVYAARHNSNNPSAAMNATSLLGSLGAAAFFLLPNSREMELEADRMGVDLSAMAGYEPKAAAEVWRKMEARGSGGRGDFLSTHPSHATRIVEVSAQADLASQRFADRRVIPTIAVAPRPRPKITDSVVCVLPGGNVEALAPVPCTRVGGTLRPVEREPEAKTEENKR